MVPHRAADLPCRDGNLNDAATGRAVVLGKQKPNCRTVGCDYGIVGAAAHHGHGDRSAIVRHDVCNQAERGLRPLRARKSEKPSSTDRPLKRSVRPSISFRYCSSMGRPECSREQLLDIGEALDPVAGDAGRDIKRPVHQFFGRHQVVDESM